MIYIPLIWLCSVSCSVPLFLMRIHVTKKRFSLTWRGERTSTSIVEDAEIQFQMRSIVFLSFLHHQTWRGVLRALPRPRFRQLSLPWFYPQSLRTSRWVVRVWQQTGRQIYVGSSLCSFSHSVLCFYYRVWSLGLYLSSSKDADKLVSNSLLTVTVFVALYFTSSCSWTLSGSDQQRINNNSSSEQNQKCSSCYIRTQVRLKTRYLTNLIEPLLICNQDQCGCTN